MILCDFFFLFRFNKKDTITKRRRRKLKIRNLFGILVSIFNMFKKMQSTECLDHALGVGIYCIRLLSISFRRKHDGNHDFDNLPKQTNNATAPNPWKRYNSEKHNCETMCEYFLTINENSPILNSLITCSPKRWLSWLLVLIGVVWFKYYNLVQGHVRNTVLQNVWSYGDLGQGGTDALDLFTIDAWRPRSMALTYSFCTKLISYSNSCIILLFNRQTNYWL